MHTLFTPVTQYPHSTPFAHSLRRYEITIDEPGMQGFPWVHQWDEDEGANHTCATSKISEVHNTTSQTVTWKIGF